MHLTAWTQQLTQQVALPVGVHQQQQLQRLSTLRACSSACRTCTVSCRSISLTLAMEAVMWCSAKMGPEPTRVRSTLGHPNTQAHTHRIDTQAGVEEKLAPAQAACYSQAELLVQGRQTG